MTAALTEVGRGHSVTSTRVQCLPSQVQHLQFPQHRQCVAFPDEVEAKVKLNRGTERTDAVEVFQAAAGEPHDTQAVEAGAEIADGGQVAVIEGKCLKVWHQCAKAPKAALTRVHFQSQGCDVTQVGASGQQPLQSDVGSRVSRAAVGQQDRSWVSDGGRPAKLQLW